MTFLYKNEKFQTEFRTFIAPKIQKRLKRNIEL